MGGKKPVNEAVVRDQRNAVGAIHHIFACLCCIASFYLSTYLWRRRLDWFLVAILGLLHGLPRPQSHSTLDLQSPPLQLPICILAVMEEETRQIKYVSIWIIVCSAWWWYMEGRRGYLHEIYDRCNDSWSYRMPRRTERASQSLRQQTHWPLAYLLFESSSLCVNVCWLLLLQSLLDLMPSIGEAISLMNKLDAIAFVLKLLCMRTIRRKNRSDGRRDNEIIHDDFDGRHDEGRQWGWESIWSERIHDANR